MTQGYFFCKKSNNSLVAPNGHQKTCLTTEKNELKGVRPMKYRVVATNGEAIDVQKYADQISNIIFDDTSEDDVIVQADGFSIDNSLTTEELVQVNGKLAELGIVVQS